jgi:predicted ATPase
MPGQRTTLVGRTAELKLLEDAFARVSFSGLSGSVAVLGATGVGKSRLIRDFLTRPNGEERRVFRASSLNGDAPLAIFERLLRSRLSLPDASSAEVSQRRIQEEVARVFGDEASLDMCQVLGSFLGQPAPARGLLRILADGVAADDAQIRARLLCRFFEADAHVGVSEGRGPLLLVFDDLHLAHSEALVLLSYLATKAHAPLLCLGIGRTEVQSVCDEFPPRVDDGGERVDDGRHRAIELAPLSESNALAVIRDLLAPCTDAESAEELAQAAVPLAGGNPALLERMVAVFKEMNVILADPFADPEVWSVSLERLEDVSVPMSVEDAVQARLAALTPKERGLLEHAAVMGAVFWTGGLVALERSTENVFPVWRANAPADSEPVRTMLRDLVSRDYVLKLPDSTFAGDDEYVFKHNLERDALSRTVSPRLMRAAHATLAGWLSFKPQVAGNEEHLARLSHHY